MDFFQEQMTVAVIFAQKFNNPSLVTDILDWLKGQHEDLKVISAESGDRSAMVRDWCIREGHEYELHTVKASSLNQMTTMIKKHRPNYVVAFQEDPDVIKAVEIADDLGVFTLIVTRWRNVKSNERNAAKAGRTSIREETSEDRKERQSGLLNVVRTRRQDRRPGKAGRRTH